MKEAIKKLKSFDIEIKTYIPIEEQANICALVMQSDDYFERKLHLVMGVFCTVVKEADSTLTYDDIVSSGIWDEVYKELKPCVDEITEAVKYYSSIEYAVTKGLEEITKGLNDFAENMPSLDKVIETIEQAQEKLESDKTNG